MESGDVEKYTTEITDAAPIPRELTDLGSPMSRLKAKGSSQKERVVEPVVAPCGAEPTIIGTSQVAKPVNAGMMAPNTMVGQ